MVNDGDGVDNYKDEEDWDDEDCDGNKYADGDYDDGGKAIAWKRAMMAITA